ncbi:MAG: hypothetical protein IPH04_08850 [Saprospirales bacterium]|nr:hypothetical protein [Saprospirales bacterium]
MKYFRFLVGFIILFWGNQTAAQQRVFDYTANTPLTPYMEYCYFLTDSAYSRESAIPLDAAFTHSGDLNFDAIPQRYWMKFSLRNVEDKQVSVQLFLGLSEILDFYIPEAQEYHRFPIGTFESRKVATVISGGGKTFLAQAMVALEPGETKTFYAYFEHLSKGAQASRDSRLEPRLVDHQIWTEKVNTTNIIWSIIFGCFLILILYHFVYYFLTRDSAYLYYCLFVFAVSFPFLTLISDVVDNPQYNALLFFSVSGLFSVFYFQLTRKFIPLQTLLPRWDKRLRLYIIAKTALVALYCLLHLITSDIFVILVIYVPAILVEFILMLLLAIALIKTKDRISLQFVFGSSLAWAGMSAVMIMSDPATSFTPQINPFKFATPAYGFVLESLVFAMVLAYRSRLSEIEKKEAKDALIRQLQENEALQEKVNKELEEKVVERTKTIELERQKSEKLLLNVLPKTIVEEMKETGTTVPQRFNNVSVLYADFVDFTRISEQLSPESLVEHLNKFFKHFDSIVVKNKLEKIKTIGDAYMCVSGLPNPDERHAQNAVRAALEFQEFLKKYNDGLRPDQHAWRLRIGIQSGPVVAGVIGDYKFTYDVWGDTVNTASRLEQHSEGGKINISEAVHELVRDEFDCKKRGTIQVKNKGEIQMYFVEKARQTP